MTDNCGIRCGVLEEEFALEVGSPGYSFECSSIGRTKERYISFEESRGGASTNP